MSLVDLNAHGWDIVIDPENGAGFRKCQFQGHDIFRPFAAGEAPFNHGNFALVPYSNRIAHGKFSYEGKKIQLPLNIEGHAHQLHGFGWQAKWDVTARQEDAVFLKYLHEKDAWPWRFEATQHWKISGDTLSCTLSIKNLSDEMMPAGLGLHPYFPRVHDAILSFMSDQHFVADEDCIPYAIQPISQSVDFSNGKAVLGTKLDDCFSCPTGKGRISWPSLNLQLDITSGPHAVHAIVFSPEGEDYFCYEPVSNINNGINWRERADCPPGIVDLAPGAVMQETTDFTVSSIKA